jgi:hypothetical protein
MIHSIVFRRLAVVLSALLLVSLSAFPVQAQDATVNLTVTSVTLDGSGGLIITATLTCSEPGQAVVRGDASQQVGRTLVFGTGEASDLVACDPAGTTVTVPIPAQVGAFRSGRVNLSLLAFLCFPDFAICSSNGEARVEGTFTVRPAR